MSDHKISLAMDAICKECDEEECMERLIGEREHLIAIADEFNKYAHPQIAPKDTVHVLLALKDAIHEQSYDARMALLQSRVAAHVWHVISQTVCAPGGEPRFKRRSQQPSMTSSCLLHPSQTSSPDHRRAPLTAKEGSATASSTARREDYSARQEQMFVDLFEERELYEQPPRLEQNTPDESCLRPRKRLTGSNEHSLQWLHDRYDYEYHELYSAEDRHHLLDSEDAASERRHKRRDAAASTNPFVSVLSPIAGPGTSTPPLPAPSPFGDDDLPPAFYENAPPSFSKFVERQPASPAPPVQPKSMELLSPEMQVSPSPQKSAVKQEPSQPKQEAVKPETIKQEEELKESAPLPEVEEMKGQPYALEDVMAGVGEPSSTSGKQEYVKTRNYHRFIAIQISRIFSDNTLLRLYPRFTRKSVSRWCETGHNRKVGGGRKIQNPKLEKDLQIELDLKQDQGLSLTRQEIENQAKLLAKHIMNKPKFSKGWIDKFKSRRTRRKEFIRRYLETEDPHEHKYLREEAEKENIFLPDLFDNDLYERLLVKKWGQTIKPISTSNKREETSYVSELTPQEDTLGAYFAPKLEPPIKKRTFNPPPERLMGMTRSRGKMHMRAMLSPPQMHEVKLERSCKRPHPHVQEENTVKIDELNSS